MRESRSIWAGSLLFLLRLHHVICRHRAAVEVRRNPERAADWNNAGARHPHARVAGTISRTSDHKTTVSSVIKADRRIGEPVCARREASFHACTERAP